MKRFGVGALLALVLGVVCRKRLVDALTATTGTWVGSPAAPRSDAG